MSVALTIAGSDSGGGAGIQADLKTFEAHGVFGTSVITALTAQSSKRVVKIWPVPEEMILAQFDVVMKDMPVMAIKTGMLFSMNIIRAIADRLKKYSLPLVVDPVMIASSGESLFDEDAMDAMKNEIFPIATIITPNIKEAERLTGIQINTKSDMEQAAHQLAKDYPNAHILLKGGHLNEMEQIDFETVSDLLFHQESSTWVSGPRIHTHNTHGTGCTLSAAITANISMGFSVQDAVTKAKQYLTKALTLSWDTIRDGSGSFRHYHKQIISA